MDRDLVAIENVAYIHIHIYLGFTPTNWLKHSGHFYFRLVVRTSCIVDAPLPTRTHPLPYFPVYTRPLNTRTYNCPFVVCQMMEERAAKEARGESPRVSSWPYTNVPSSLLAFIYTSFEYSNSQPPFSVCQMMEKRAAKKARGGAWVNPQRLISSCRAHL